MRKTRAPAFKLLVRVRKIEKPKEEISTGGIFLKSHSQHDLELEQQGMCEGHVVDIGPTAFIVDGVCKPWCGKGDCIMFHKHAGVLMEDLDSEGFLYRMISDLDVQAVFPDEAIAL